MLLYQIYAWKNIKSHTKTRNLKYLGQREIKSLNYLKLHETVTDNYPINKIENRITFRIKTRCYLELSILVTMKFLGSTKSKITKDENKENVPHLEITEVVLVHCDTVSNDY